MVTSGSDGGGKDRASADKFKKLKNSLAEPNPEKRLAMLVEGIVDLLVSNDVNHEKMLEGIDAIRESMQSLKDEVSSELLAIEAAMGATGLKQQSIDRRLATIEKNVGKVDQQVSKIEADVGKINPQVFKIEGIRQDLDEVLRLLRDRK